MKSVKSLLLLAALLVAFLPATVRAQSNPNWALRFVPTNTQWNAEWSTKQDYSPTLTSYANLTGTGLVQTVNGVPIVGTLSNALTNIAGTTVGTLLVNGPSGYGGLPPGATGLCLVSNGTNAIPGWGSCGSGGGGGGGTVSSVGLSLPGIFTVSGSPVATAGVLTATFAPVNANQFLAGPLTGSASPLALRTIGNNDLPLPTATAIGAFTSKAAISHQFLTSATTGGAFTSAQPAAADISDCTSACTTAIGTSGATIPLLNGNNTWSGINAFGRVRVASRTITAAGAVTVSNTSDFFVCINKTSGAATTVNLPASPVAGDTYVIADCKGDAGTNNITVVPNAGNIDGGSSFVMSTAYAAQGFTYSGAFWKAN